MPPRGVFLAAPWGSLGEPHGGAFRAQGLGGKHMLAACWHVLPAGVLGGSLGGPWGALGVPVGAPCVSLVVLWGFSRGSRVGLGAPWRPAVVLFLPGGVIVGIVASSGPLWGSFC